MTASFILDIASLILCLGIVISMSLAAVRSRKTPGKLASDIFYFSGITFLTVFLAFRASEYANEKNVFQCAFMLAGICGGMAALIGTHYKCSKRMPPLAK